MTSIFRVLKEPPELAPLLSALRDQAIDYLLVGKIPHSNLLFVDIDRDVASQLVEKQLPHNWAIIYPYFLSSQALLQGEPEPLLQGISAEAIVEAYGGNFKAGSDEYEALCDQTRYLMNFPPSRLVWLGSTPPTDSEIEQLLLNISTVKK